ncbi:hypothetical protein IQ267_25495 [filamentous cyanobacterium LEGE 07170]|nr:hypothetical protein [filamentous cyanobacterium LEGE 07170]
MLNPEQTELISKHLCGQISMTPEVRSAILAQASEHLYASLGVFTLLPQSLERDLGMVKYKALLRALTDLEAQPEVPLPAPRSPLPPTSIAGSPNAAPTVAPPETAGPSMRDSTT